MGPGDWGGAKGTWQRRQKQTRRTYIHVSTPGT